MLLASGCPVVQNCTYLFVLLPLLFPLTCSAARRLSLPKVLSTFAPLYLFRIRKAAIAWAVMEIACLLRECYTFFAPAFPDSMRIC